MTIELHTASPRSRPWRESPSPPERGREPAPALPLALFLTVLLTAWWTALAWSDLAALRLPGADAMIRLAQLRDWLGGQGFGDLTQSRLGPPGGIAMPLSRLPDIVPGLVVGLLSPLMGVTRAEIAAVIFWPELLFLLHLLLAGGLARRLGGGAALPVAIALAALAFPAIDLFMPGRIDHHGLQLVLVEAMMLGILGRHGFLAGCAAALSLLVGVEAVPVIAAAMIGLAGLWTQDRRSIGGFGLGLLGVALAGFIMLRPQIWPADRCDGFTPPLFALMLIASGAWLVLAGLAPRLPDWRWRAGAASAVAAVALAAGWVAAPACFSAPYGPVDPLLVRVWPGQTGGYGGLIGQGAGTIVAFMGLPLMALAAAGVFAIRGGERRGSWIVLTVVIAASIAAAFAELRAAWFAAALAAPVLAQLVQLARGRGFAWQAGAWLLSAGVAWQSLGSLAEASEPLNAAQCADAGTLAALDRLDTGTFAAPMELSANIVGATQHRSLAGPYRRNAQGNRTTAQLFLSSPEEARYQASLWTVDYVALCPTKSGGLPPTLLRPGGLAAQLLNGDPPAWLDPVPLIGSDTLVWRVRAIAAPGLRP